jgi:hypothetical protein
LIIVIVAYLLSIEETPVGPAHDLQHLCKITIPLNPDFIVSEAQRKKKDALKYAAGIACSKLIEKGLLFISGHPQVSSVQKGEIETICLTC